MFKMFRVMAGTDSDSLLMSQSLTFLNQNMRVKTLSVTYDHQDDEMK